MLEQVGAAVEQLGFPLANLVGVDAGVAAELRQRFGAFGSFQGELELVFRTVLPAFLGHQQPSTWMESYACFPP